MDSPRAPAGRGSRTSETTMSHPIGARRQPTRTRSRQGLRRELTRVRPQIVAHVARFQTLRAADDARWFDELCFCLLAVQANAHLADEAATRLRLRGLLDSGGPNEIRPHLRKVRFLNTKAKWIVAAREFAMGEGMRDLRSRLARTDPREVREWLVDRIDGFGFKEASHYLRNLGYGEDLAILDRHILRSLVRLRVIPKLPTLSRTRYLDIEDRMRTFARSLDLSLAQADAFLWWRETGELFK